MEYKLRITGEQAAVMVRHLFPGDGKEAAALLLCGRHQGRDLHALCVREVLPIPYEACVRAGDRITWPTQWADRFVQMALREGLGLVKVHGHPASTGSFSPMDDVADRSFIGSVQHCLEDGLGHGSAILLRDGTWFGRVLESDGQFRPMNMVSVVGDDLDFWFDDQTGHLQHQVFGEGTTEVLRRLSIAVVGCSGTGTPTLEQLMRLGVRRLVLIDFDRVEHRNLNRMYNVTTTDATEGRLKVEVIAEAIRRTGLGTEVIPIVADLRSPEAVKAVAGCDVVFGCMDSAYGRDLLNRLATFYVLPYIDIGVQITAGEAGRVRQIMGAVHYLQPGRSSLRSRRVYDTEDVRAELLSRDDPESYSRLRAQKYIKGVAEQRPAVISVNTQVSAMAVNEFLARVHRFRFEPNSRFAIQWVAFHEGCVFSEPEDKQDQCQVLRRHVGRGDVVPLLDRPELSIQEAQCVG